VNLSSKFAVGSGGGACTSMAAKFSTLRDLGSLIWETVASTPGLSHWPVVAAWWKERIRYVGLFSEHTTVVFAPISADTGLDKVHPTWHLQLDACVFLFPSINFALIDSDCVPVTLFEIQELWLSWHDPLMKDAVNLK